MIRISNAQRERPPLFQLSDLVVPFVLLDCSIVGLRLASERRFLAGALLVAAMAATTIIYLTASKDGWRTAAILCLAFLSTTGFMIAFLWGLSAHFPYHDGILSVDAAADYLIRGIDPYGPDYLYTPMRIYYVPDMPVNFGLDRLVYPPGLVLLSAPLRWLAARGGPDGGLIWLYPVALTCLIAAAHSLGTTREESRVAVAAICLNPLLIISTGVEYYNDVFFLVPLVASVASLRRSHPALSGLLLATAVLCKQDAVVLTPFLALGWYQSGGLRWIMGAFTALFATLAVVLLPFALWNVHTFLGDVIGTFYGSGHETYPIRGIGLPGLLLKLHHIPSRWVAFPSLALQLAVTLPLLLAALYALYRNWTWRRFWAGVAVITFALFFFGRAFVQNYLDVTAILATIAFVQSMPDPLRLRSAGQLALSRS